MKVILLTLITMLAIGGLPELIGWIEWKIKYPIVSDTIPMRILSVGDLVTFGNGNLKFRYRGRDDVNFDFVFENYETLLENRMTREDVLSNISSVSSKYGLKWRKPKK